VAAILSGISTHILDTSLGRPAADVSVTLEQNVDGAWQPLSHRTTDLDGRVKQMLPEAKELETGEYRLTFGTGAYFEATRVAGLYPEVQITFSVRESDGHYHIPLLLTANGYSTYRGS
jgi:5-hydroxyisourate hydrolase